MFAVVKSPPSETVRSASLASNVKVLSAVNVEVDSIAKLNKLSVSSRLNVAEVSVGAVSVLFVSVSVVSLPTKVSVDVGKVSVPVLLIVEIIGAVSVLFVSVSVPSRVASVPVVGRVMLVAPV